MQNSCRLSFSFIGYRVKIIPITQDTNVTVELEPDISPASSWFTVGTDYDAFNSTAGLLLSNGYNEHPLIHFEDFSESWIYKVNGTTDFQKDYSFGVKLARDYVLRRMYMPAIEYRKINYISNEFRYTDINLSFGIRVRGLKGNALIKTGYQQLNKKDNFGAGIGWQNSHRNPNLYYGFLVGRWTDYWVYNAFIQGFDSKTKLSIRASYERIDSYNFLTVGIHYTFRR